MKEQILRLYPDIRFCANPYQTYWDRVVSPSCVGDGSLFDFDTKDYILVEEGLSDYTTQTADTLSEEIRRRCTIYTCGELSIDTKVLYRETKILRLNPQIISAMTALFLNDIFAASGSSILFITNPIDIDHGLDIGEIVKMIERDYAGQSILVKPHPRDRYDYESNIVHFNNSRVKDSPASISGERN